MLQLLAVIRSFRHKGLRELFETGRTRRIRADQQAKLLRLMDILDGAAVPADMNLPGAYFHKLRGNPERYSVRVTGNWRLTYGWHESDAVDVDFEDYH